MTWTQFWDMHSGGRTKEPPYEMIYIEAPKAEAKTIFYNRFGHNPERVSCTCCGDDYSIDEEPTLAQLTGYHRGLRAIQTPRDPETNRYIPIKEENGYTAEQVVYYKAHYYLESGEEPQFGFTAKADAFQSRKGPLTVEEYAQKEDVLIIAANHIRPAERDGLVPEAGYVWVGE